MDDSQVELDVEVGDLSERAFERELDLPEFQEFFGDDEDDLRGVDEHDYEPGASTEGVEYRVQEGQTVEQPASSSGVDQDADDEFMEVSHEALDHVPSQEAEDMVMNVELRDSVVFAVGRHCGLREQLVELGGEKLWLEIPSQSKDDVRNLLDVEMTYDGMLRELKALESLGVGDVVWQVPPGKKVISARWVTNAKKVRVEGREVPLVCCRVVARDFAQGASAAQLGITSPTSSAEALRVFLALAGSSRQNIVGLDVSTAFLFAELDEDERVYVHLPEGVRGKDGRRGFLRLKKALYGLRVAAQAWARHLAKLLKRLCDLEPCETEPCLFAGSVLEGQRVAVLCYVDDILVTGESDEAIYHIVDCLKSVVKLKLTADLDRDGAITFLGRQIHRKSHDDSLIFGVSDDYYKEIFDGFGLSKSVNGTMVPPNIRDLYDKDDPKLEVELSNDVAARFRSTLGRLSWLAMTHVDLVYYVSMLARGQATPKEKHERALRMVLRYLKGVSGYRQVIGAQSDFELRCYVDASWGSERSTGRKSISEGAVFLRDVVLKEWARLQQAVALSSAEAELYGLVEGAKEALAL